MATIEVRKSCFKTSYRARVRVKGYPQVTASFARKTDAKRWAAGIEADIHLVDAPNVGVTAVLPLDIFVGEMVGTESP
jgi:hypothetical protein